MNLILMTVGGILARMVVTSLGATLIGLNVPPEVAAKIVELAQSLGGMGGAVAGLVAMALAFGWSYWQKSRSGATTAKP